MATIKNVVMPMDERGNDPNDWKDDTGFVEKLKPTRAIPKLDWTKNFVLSKEEADMIADPNWIVPNLIIQGHVIAIPAPPNAGKTTIFLWIAGEIAPHYQVFYVNADISGGDAKTIIHEAASKGFTMLLPDMKAGLSMEDVVENLENMNEVDADYSTTIFIFDTLKKMVDVINKSKAKQLFKTLRGLSAKGMTIILLCHTNKYNDDDGKPIYEGTGDLRADVDELIYLAPKKNVDGSMVVSTLPDKVRGAFSPLTFNITVDRKVSLSDQHVDVVMIKQADARREKDATVIEAIIDTIKVGKVRQTEIITHCKAEYGIGWRTVERVLGHYSQPPFQLWKRDRAFQNNSWNYQLEGDSHG